MVVFVDVNVWFIVKGWVVVVQGFCVFCQVDQYVQFGQCVGVGLQIGEMWQQQVEQFVIKLFFQCQCFVFGGQYFIFVFFQFRNNVVFGVFQCLVVYVVDWCEVVLVVVDLDVVVVDGVVVDFQGIEVQLFVFVDFQFIEIIGGVIGQCLLFVQFFVIVWGDDFVVVD